MREVLIGPPAQLQIHNTYHEMSVAVFRYLVADGLKVAEERDLLRNMGEAYAQQWTSVGS